MPIGWKLKKRVQSILDRELNLPIVLINFKNFYFVRFGLISALALFFGMIGFIVLSTEIGISQETIVYFLFFCPINLIFVSFILNIFINLNNIFQDIKYLKNISFSFFGGLFGILISFWILARMNNINFLLLLDTGAILVGFIHSFARTACINYGCCHGKEISNFQGSELHLYYTNPLSKAARVSKLENRPLYPIQVYESLGCLSIGIFIVLLSRVYHKLGLLTGVYLLLYGALRFVCELYRGEADTIFWKSISVYQWISLGFILSGVCLLGLAFHLNISENISFHWSNLRILLDFWIYLIIMPFTIFFFYGFHYKSIGKWC